MTGKIFFSFCATLILGTTSAQQLHVNAKTGNDKNPGTPQQPLQTIGEAAKRIDSAGNTKAASILIAAGVYPLQETVRFSNNRFTAENRLLIRAEILPGDSNWNPQCMPIITSVIPGVTAAGDGEESKGFEINVSHATIQGLRFTGSPAYYYIDGKQNRRYYPVWRNGASLEDLYVTQCVFAGNADIMPIRVAVIAKGHGLVVDHCVFFNCQNAVVFWDADGGTSYHNVMRYCLVYESNYSGVWTTTNTADDFEFHHNIIAGCRTGWIRDKNSTHHYSIHDCIFSGNTKFTGNGGDAVIESDFLQTTNVLFNQNIILEKDQGKLNYLQLKNGSDGTALKAGLFLQ